MLFASGFCVVRMQITPAERPFWISVLTFFLICETTAFSSFSRPESSRYVWHSSITQMIGYTPAASRTAGATFQKLLSPPNRAGI
ncbi:hypothetical protein TSOC111612_24085 [Tsukamurella ocularis]